MGESLGSRSGMSVAFLITGTVGLVEGHTHYQMTMSLKS